MPNAWYALFALENWKYSITNEELGQIFNAFDDQTKQTYSARKIKEFLDARPNENAPRPNPMLTDNYGKTTPMIDTSKKLNMVILWASWCGPCKEEIPLLKHIAIKFKNNDFRMVSISIDKDKTEWKRELEKQDMPWQQLVIPDDGYQHVIAQYNLSSVPRVYLIDKNRKLVKFVDGYQPENEAIFTKTITDYLKL